MHCSNQRRPAVLTPSSRSNRHRLRLLRPREQPRAVPAKAVRRSKAKGNDPSWLQTLENGQDLGPKPKGNAPSCFSSPAPSQDLGSKPKEQALEREPWPLPFLYALVAPFTSKLATGEGPKIVTVGSSDGGLEVSAPWLEAAATWSTATGVRRGLFRCVEVASPAA